MNIFTPFILLVFFTSSFIDYKIGTVLLLLSSIIIFFGVKVGKIDVNKKVAISVYEKYVVGAFVAYGIALCIFNFIQGAPGKYYDAPSKNILAIPIFWMLLRFRLQASTVFGIVSIASLFGGIFAIYEFLITGFNRPYPFGINPNYYSMHLQAFGFVSLFGFAYIKEVQAKYNFAYKLLLILGFSTSFLGTIFCASRGVWLAMPVQLALVSLLFFSRYKKMMIGSVVGFIMLFSILYAIPQTNIQSRFQAAINDVATYQQNNTRSSLGARFEFWRTAYELPVTFFGTSVVELEKQTQNLVEKEIINKYMQQRVMKEHFHSFYVEKYVRQGVFGFLTALGLLIALIATFLGASFTSKRNKVIACAGISTVISYAIYSIPETAIGTSYISIPFMIIIVMLSSLVKIRE